MFPPLSLRVSTTVRAYTPRSWAAPPPESAPRGLNTASAAQINLRPSREFGAYNFGRPRASSIYGDSSTSRHGSQDPETTSHLDSRDFSGIDLQLGLDDSVEYGRNAQQALNSREGSLASGRRIRGSSLGMGSIRDADPMDISFEPVDLGLDFGDVEQPGLENRSRRECWLLQQCFWPADECILSKRPLYPSSHLPACGA